MLGSTLRLTVAAAIVASIPAAAAAQGEVNIYSSRHYDNDEQLYSGFEEATGIKVNRIEDSADVLIERMKSEGRNSPADVFIATDAGRLWRAEEAGLLQPAHSELIAERVPEHFRHPDGLWTGYSKRARIIFYDKDGVEDVPETYQDLADPKYEGMVCTRSSSNIYMLSLLASIIENEGEDAAEEWAQGVWNNRARDPQGGDTDQLRGIVSGECDIVLANHYYFVRGVAGDVSGLTGSTDEIGVVFPNQDTTGTHVNISGAGMAVNAPHPDNALAFLEYLASADAQEYFAAGNYEFPVSSDVENAGPVADLGTFKEDEMNLSKLGENQAAAQAIYDRVGYK
ncbi:extracellular solute-binding protein [Amorphus orientalis]|uniref:Iron(III) transport system substrate-binding protein n=1 Tax=Amorphus orientalis TaxID=649198 RepID=A0AAE3VKF6_9HYPH|nr:extracellular solute-binding protein [Amorphus orientalis]MDQ0313568.1 iron(III) transport system substrate-binding protein [Amorphus orientalis]